MVRSCRDHPPDGKGHRTLTHLTLSRSYPRCSATSSAAVAPFHRCAALIPLRHVVSALFEPLSLDFLRALNCQDGGSVEAARLEILERLLRVSEGVFVGGNP
jgi:hypothetical protein